MKLLKTIQSRDFSPAEIETFFHRLSVRAVIFDDERKIGILYVSKKNFYKLPGGGIEENENKLEALHRECLEELGCEIEINHEIGQIIELRDANSSKQCMKQESFCYLGKVVGKKNQPNFTSSEIKHGFEIQWLDLDQAIQLILNQADRKRGETNFVKQRESLILQEAKKYLLKI